MTQGWRGDSSSWQENMAAGQEVSDTIVSAARRTEMGAGAQLLPPFPSFYSFWSARQGMELPIFMVGFPWTVTLQIFSKTHTPRGVFLGASKSSPNSVNTDGQPSLKCLQSKNYKSNFVFLVWKGFSGRWK